MSNPGSPTMSATSGHKSKKTNKSRVSRRETKKKLKLMELKKLEEEKVVHEPCCQAKAKVPFDDEGNPIL